MSRGAVLAACCTGMVAMGVATNVGPLCLTALAADLQHMGRAAQGWFLGVLFFGGVAGILTSGPLGDRIGFRVPLAVSALLQAGGLLVVSAAASPAVALCGAGLAGFGCGVLDALVTPLACAAFPRSRGRTANFLHAFYPVGMFVVVLGVLGLFHAGWPWRAIYRLAAVACLPHGAAFLVLRLPDKSHEGDTRLPARRLLRRGSFLLLVGCIFLAGLTELGASQWLPAYIEEATGGVRAAGALGLLLFGTAMTLGRLLNSAASRRFGAQRLFTLGATLCIACLLLAAVPAPAAFTTGCLAVLGMAVSGLWPNTLALAGDRFPRAGASMYAVLHAAGNMGGSGPVFVGLVGAGLHLRAGIGFLAAAPMAAILLAAGFARMAQRAGES